MTGSAKRLKKKVGDKQAKPGHMMRPAHVNATNTPSR